MNLAELRAKLREARKECVKPVSKMRKGDIAAELERMGKMREETPHAAAVPSAKSRKAEPAVAHVRSAKEAEFPESSKPHKAEHHARKESHYMPKAAAKPKAAKSPMSKATLRAMLDEMTSDEE